MRILFIIFTSIFFFVQSAFSYPEDSQQSLASLSCIQGEFSANHNGRNYQNSLIVKNTCSKSVEIRNSKFSWNSPIALDTEFWGNFPSITYPLTSSLHISSRQINQNNHLTSINLKFATNAITKLPVNHSFIIRWISNQPGFTRGTFQAEVTSTPSAQTPVQRNGQLKVCGTRLCNQRNEAIQLKGISSHGLQWYGIGKCLTSGSLDYLANAAKASVFRIAMYVQEGGYETNPAKFTQEVHDLIEKATRRGMYVIVDFHILTPGNPFHNLERAKRFFTDIANRHKNKNNILYEIANEPNGVDWFTIKGYAEQIIPVIRAIDRTAPIIVGTPGWSSLGLADGRNAQDIIDNPLNFSNIMYAFHFYAASHRDDHLQELDRASNLIPIFVSEFGTQTFTGDGNNDFAMMNRYMTLMAAKKIGWVNWNYSDDHQSSAIWKEGTCINRLWNDNQLKPSGVYIKNKILNNT